MNEIWVIIILTINFATKNLVSLYMCTSFWTCHKMFIDMINWWFEYCHFNKYFILYIGTGVMNRARPIRFFSADTDYFVFSLPITNAEIFALLKECLFCLKRQNKHFWSYFAFSQKWLIELVTWQVWHAWLLSWLWCL